MLQLQKNIEVNGYNAFLQGILLGTLEKCKLKGCGVRGGIGRVYAKAGWHFSAENEDLFAGMDKSFASQKEAKKTIEQWANNAFAAERSPQRVGR